MNAVCCSATKIYIFIPVWLWLCLPVGFFVFFLFFGNLILLDSETLFSVTLSAKYVHLKLSPIWFQK